MPKILIVDDEAALRELLEWELSQQQYDVRAACNGKEALDVVANYQPDLIITDMVMPEMDGLAFLNELHLRYGGAPPAILTSGIGTTLTAEHARLNIVALVAKPYRPHDVSTAVVTALTERQDKQC